MSDGSTLNMSIKYYIRGQYIKHVHLILCFMVVYQTYPSKLWLVCFRSLHICKDYHINAKCINRVNLILCQRTVHSPCQSNIMSNDCTSNVSIWYYVRGWCTQGLHPMLYRYILYIILILSYVSHLFNIYALFDLECVGYGKLRCKNVIQKEAGWHWRHLTQCDD